MGQINLGGLWGLFETRIGMCTFQDGAFLIRDGNRLEPRYKDGEHSDIAGEGVAFRDDLRNGLEKMGVDYRDSGMLRLVLADKAEEFKREGDLSAAYGAYATLFTVEDKWDLMNVRRFSNLFLLDKNFVDLEKILRYIHAFAVRINKDKLSSGERLDFESWGTNVVWGDFPFLEFEDYAPFHVLNAINGGYNFTSKESIAECARARGGLAADGTSRWENYSLSDLDFVNFLMVFGQGF